MNQSEQFKQILRNCGSIDRDLQKIKTDIHNLTSITGALTAEIHMLAERIDIHVNQDFARTSFAGNPELSNLENKRVTQK